MMLLLNNISMSSSIFILVNTQKHTFEIYVSLKNAPKPIFFSPYLPRYLVAILIVKRESRCFRPKICSIYEDMLIFIYLFVVVASIFFRLISSSVLLLLLFYREFLSAIISLFFLFLARFIHNASLNHRNMFLCASGFCCVCVFFWALNIVFTGKTEINER